MSIGQIILYIVIFILVLYTLSKLLRGQTTLSDFNDATQPVDIPSANIPTADGTMDYTYSIWIYVTDWSYRYGQQKVIFERTVTDPTRSNIPINSPKVYLDETNNDLEVELTCGTETGGLSPTGQPFNCKLQNIPLQRWANIIMSVGGRSLDLYLNGKLVKSCIAPQIPLQAPNADILLCPAGGFAGYVSQFKYFPNVINPQEAWNIYRKGPGGSILGNMFNKYKLQFSFLKDDVAQFSFST